MHIDVAGNYASRFYKFAMTDVFRLQSSLQAFSVAEAAAVDAKVSGLLAHESGRDEAAAVRLLDAFSEHQAATILSGWNSLLGLLITKYHDGYRAESLAEPTISMHKFFYPRWWLEAAGYFRNAPNTGPDVIMFEPQHTPHPPRHGASLLWVLTLVLTAALCAGVGYSLGKRVPTASRQAEHAAYTQL